MTRHDVTLHDRYNLAKSPVLLNGTQALVRLMLMQKARDREAGLNTAGYVTGYRGSPMGAVDQQMARARDVLEASDVRFQPGLNEDLAATALWGTQQAELRGEGRFDGVFGLWYGKGPGVDRSGDAMRHANMAGTSSRGGVIMALGDDHTGESSTTCHQSDWAAVDAYIPVLSPAGVQEVLDYGLYGFALSRYSGLWTGLKLMKDTVEVTSVVDGSPGRMRFVEPDFAMPEGGLNIRLADHWIPQEARITDYKRFAAEAFSHANGIDRRVHGRPGAKIGFCAAGKNWLDLEHALSLLGIDGKGAERLGLTAYKIGQTFPLDMAGFRDWAEGLDLIVVVEEKRKLIEVQAKEAIFDDRRGRRIYGWRDDKGNELFPTRFALDPALIAEKIGGLLLEEGRDSESVRAGLRRIEEARGADNAPDIASRIPYFCSGCPHNSSTLVPEGSRAYAGIGCHFMAQWMDRDTQGFTHMGAEGANWVGEAPFSTRSHVFQNLGDGTYNHSGVQAIRFALMAGVNITYKILYNDAVAMTGGQANDGGLGPDQIARELAAMGVRRIACVYDEKEEPDWTGFPRDTLRRPRSELDAVQKEFAAIEGVTAIVYIQTCAAEKRRRRKRGTFPDAGRRVFIDPDVCEGCGDCGIRSNCVSIVPLETELGRKRAIDQSSCNADFSCLQGFCPSFMTVEGGAPRRRAATGFETGELVEPVLPTIDGTWNVVVAGVGGTGVVTIGAVLAMAAHLDEKGVGMMEMAGLAQKGGAVHIHCRIADDPSGINAIRVAVGECDALIGGDLVVSAGAKTIGLLKTGRTGATVNAHEIVTGEFARNAEFSLPAERMRLSLEARLGDRLAMFDASELSRILTGDAIFSNMIVFGAAWQKSLVPVTRESILRAIELNGAAVEGNKRAFEIGRWAALNPEKARNVVDRDAAPTLGTLEERIAYRARHLEKYQSKSLAERYRAFVDSIGDPRLREAAAKGYHKLLAYKDEYEVARLLSGASAKVRAEFDGARRISYHLAPPMLARTGLDGRPAKYRFGSGIALLFPLLASLKWLRGTPFDPFGRTAERRMERELIRTYETDMAEILRDLTEERLEPAVALAELPLSIRGFGPVKLANAEKAERRREELLTAFRAAPAPARAAE